MIRALLRLLTWDTFFGVLLILLVWFLFLEVYFPC